MRSLLLLFLLFATGIQAAPPAKSKAVPAQSDAVIEQNIRARFSKSKIAEDKFTVRVQGGVAVIEGNTSVIQRKGVATRLAKAGGARAVNNRIRIAEDARAKAAEKLRENRPRQMGRPVPPSAVKPAASVAVPQQPPVIPRAQVKH